jgi:uncharacterized cupredoxin-like copper-binding protein
MIRRAPSRPGRARFLATVALVAFGWALAGCSNAPASPGASASATSSSSLTLRVTVKGKDVTPAPGDFELRAGQTLHLTVTSDHDDELHVHGFEKEVSLSAGRPTTLDLVTSQPGSYVVETHHPELRLLTIQVR